MTSAQTQVPQPSPDGHQAPAPRRRSLFRRHDPNPEKYLTLIEHLQELRYRLIVSAGAVLVATIISFIFTNRLLQYLVQPVRESAVDARVIYTEPLGFIAPYFRVALLAGIAGAMPVVLYQIMAFVSPGLTPQEKRWVIPLVLGATVLFVIGCVFAFYTMLPPALRFLLGISPENIEAAITVKSYIDFVTRLMLVTGLIFELPLVVMGLAKLGLVRAQKLLSWWRYAVVGAFLIAAIVTPSIDPVTQTLLALPMIALYFLGIVLAKLVEPNLSSAET